MSKPQRSQSWAGTRPLLEDDEIRQRSFSCRLSRTGWEEGQIAAHAGQCRSGQSVTGGVFILCNVTIGLAMLDMPYTFKLVGSTMILVMLFMGGVSMFTAHLTYKAIDMATPLAESGCVPMECRDWGYLAEVAFGKVGRLAANFCFRGELVAYILSFLCTLGVHLHLLLPVVSTVQGVILSCIATFIMSYLPELLLSKVALSAHFAYVIVVVCLYYSEYVDLEQPDAPCFTELVGENWSRVGIMDALPNLPTVFEVCVYSWAGHSILPTIASSLTKPSNVKRVIGITFPVAVGVAMCIGLSGYLILGPHTDQVFTENLGKVYWKKPQGELLKDLYWMRVLAAISVIIKLGATIPCWMHPFLVSTEAGIQNPIAKSFWRASIVLAMGMVACIFQDQVVIAVAFAGATFGNALVFILPCTVYYGIKRRISRVGCAETSLLAAILGLGSILIVYGVYDCLRQLLSS